MLVLLIFVTAVLAIELVEILTHVIWSLRYLNTTSAKFRAQPKGPKMMVYENGF